MTRLEAVLAARADDIKRLESANSRLQAEIEGLWPRWLNIVLSLGPGLLATLTIVFGFVLPKMKKSVEEDGPKAIFDAVIKKLYEDDEIRFTKLFEAHRKEITRSVMAKDRPIILVGEHDDRERIKELLETAGYKRFVEDISAAHVVVLLGPDACEHDASRLIDTVRREGTLKFAVLYTGAARIKDSIIDELNRVTLAIPANTPTTVVSHVITLAMLTQSLR